MHDLVARVGGGLGHQRAPAVDHPDAVLAAVPGGRLGDAAGARAAVHPHAVDVQGHGLTHGRLGVRRTRTDDDGLDAAGNRGEVGEAVVALDLLGVGIDGEDVVAAV